MNEIDRNDLEGCLGKAEENLSEVLELASGLKETSSDEVLSWLIEHALDAWADIRRAKRAFRALDEEGGEPE